MKRAEADVSRINKNIYEITDLIKDENKGFSTHGKLNIQGGIKEQILDSEIKIHIEKARKKQADCETVFDGDHYFSDEAAFERKSRSING